MFNGIEFFYMDVLHARWRKYGSKGFEEGYEEGCS